MKRGLLLCLLLCIGQLSIGQIVTIPDANFKTALIEDGVDTNDDGEIQVSEAENTTSININGTGINSIVGIQSFTNLVSFICKNGSFETADLSGLSKLETIDFEAGILNSIVLSGLSSLTSLDCSNNELTNLDVSHLSNLKEIYCYTNELTSLNISGLSNLEMLNCSSNNLTQIDLSGAVNIRNLYLSYNQISSQNDITNLDNLSNLEVLNCSNNTISELDVRALTSLERLLCDFNGLSSLDVSNLGNLEVLSCNFNQLTTLDVSSNISLNELNASGNQLISLFIKNGQNEQIVIHNNETLQYICVDQEELETTQTMVNALGYTNCVINPFCSFSPGGEVFYLQGNVHLDLDANGCDTNDIDFGGLRLKVTNANSETQTFSTNSDGSYDIPLDEGTYTVEPILENPSYFDVSPASYSVNFATDVSPYLQDFCLTANGVVQDLEIQIIPLELARPGFDADYKIVYKNNGTSTVSGNVTLTYDDNVMDLVSSDPNFTSATPSFLSWAYTNLTPSETREILVTMNLNSPMETPSLNEGDILCFDAAITPVTNDQRVNDNTFTLKQTVVNSYDPNDKTCLQGNTVTPDLIGEYVHYLIRFENTGTASAINVVVKDIIDTNKFDISSMVVYDASHDMVTRIQNTNEVEFIFEGINLPFDDANNDGYILFKIKTLSSLVVGDTFENHAEIYFDFNFPIITNTEQTTIENTASTDDILLNAQLRLFPNPTDDSFTIESSVAFDSVTIYDLKGRQLRTMSNTSPQLSNQIDVGVLASGIYYVSIQLGKSKKLIKFIRE